MRTTLFVSLLLAVIAVVFAMQNPGVTELIVGPYTITASTALVIVSTLGIGFMLGILAMLPRNYRQHRKVRNLEKTMS
jgi:putative membrane protein